MELIDESEISHDPIAVVILDYKALDHAQFMRNIPPVLLNYRNKVLEKD